MFAMFRKLYIQILIVVEFLAKRRRILIELRNRLQGILDHTKNSAIVNTMLFLKRDSENS